MILASANFGESFILEWVALLIVALVVRRYVVPPLRRMMNARMEAIRSQLAAGDEAREAAARLVEERRAELETARTQAATIVSQARQSASQLISDAERRSEEEYERLVSHAAAQIDLELGRIRTEIILAMSSFVVSGARRLVDAELNAQRHRGLIAEAITAVESEATA